MDLPLSTVVIILLCVIVAAAGIIFAMGAIGEGKRDTEYYWNIEQCIPLNNRCTLLAGGRDDCCESLVCIRPSPEDGYRLCLEPRGEDFYCERNTECISNDCVNNFCV